MGRKIQLAPFAVLFIVLAILQVALIAADCQQTPARVAKQFSRSYVYLDTDMQDYLCDELVEGGAVDNYLYAKKREADQRGFSTNYLRHLFTKLHVETLSRDDTTARIHVSGTTRVAINPAFMVVGKLFSLADSYHREATLDLVKQDGAWKICGEPFGLQPAY